MMDLGAFPGQMSIIPDDTAVYGEVIFQTSGVIAFDLLLKKVYLHICGHFVW